jgi:hypothetical protein
MNPPNLIAAASGCWGGIPHGGSPDIALLYSKQFNNYSEIVGGIIISTFYRS